MKKLLLTALIACLMPSVIWAFIMPPLPDAGEFLAGNEDMSTIITSLDRDVDIDIWARTPSDDREWDDGEGGIIMAPDTIAAFQLVITHSDPLFSGDTYTLYAPYSLWDLVIVDPAVYCDETEYDYNPWGYLVPSAGRNWTFIGVMDTDGNPPYYPLFQPSGHVKLATMYLHTSDNPLLVGQTVYGPFMSAMSKYNDEYTYMVSVDGVKSYNPSLACSPIYFSPNAPPDWTDVPSSILECWPAFYLYTTLVGDDADPDDLDITLTGPGTLNILVDTPGHIEAEWYWTPMMGDIGDTPVTFTLTDGLEVVPYTTTVACHVDENAILDIEGGEGAHSPCVIGVPGTHVEVPIWLYNEEPCGGMQLLFAWDPAVLQMDTGVFAVPSAAINNGDGYYLVESPVAGPGTCRITWFLFDPGTNPPTFYPPKAVGDDIVCTLNFDIAWGDYLHGIITEIFFLDRDVWGIMNDNCISDETGYLWTEVVTLAKGCVEIEDPTVYKGDPNMNTVYYDIADAVLVARRIVEGYDVWSENGLIDDAIQECAADVVTPYGIYINDLVMFVNVVNGHMDPPYSYGPKVAGDNLPEGPTKIYGDPLPEGPTAINIDREVAAAFVTINHTGELGAPVASNGMDLLYTDTDGVMKVLVYSLDSKTTAGELFTVPVISGSISFGEVSASDANANLLNVTAGLVSRPTEFAVKGVYPNPFNNAAKVTFALPEASDVTCQIYSITGQLVETMTGHYEAGVHSITWNATVASGVYFAKIMAGDNYGTVKMTLLK